MRPKFFRLADHFISLAHVAFVEVERDQAGAVVKMVSGDRFAVEGRDEVQRLLALLLPETAGRE